MVSVSGRFGIPPPQIGPGVPLTRERETAMDSLFGVLTIRYERRPFRSKRLGA